MELLLLLGCHGNCSMKDGWKVCVITALLEQMDKCKASCVSSDWFYLKMCVHYFVCVCVFRYNELLFIIDTCQGASMYERFYSPNIMALASSQVGEDSLSVSYFILHHLCKY